MYTPEFVPREKISELTTPLRKLLLVLGASLLAGCAAETSQLYSTADQPMPNKTAASNKNSQQKNMKSPHNFPDSYSKINELPGYGQKVTEYKKSSLSRSSVGIYFRPRGTQYIYNPLCSGIVISTINSDEPQILTAAHCFEQEWGGARNGYLWPERGRLASSIQRYVKIPKDRKNNYAVKHIASDHPTALANIFNSPPIDYSAEEILLSTSSDRAILRISNTFGDNSIGLEQRQGQPIVGQEVYLFGSGDGTADGHTGVYLGLVNNEENGSLQYITAFRDIGKTKACSPGDSGAGVVFADGSLFTLSEADEISVINTTYSLWEKELKVNLRNDANPHIAICVLIPLAEAAMK